MKSYSYDLRARIYNFSLTHTIRETAEIFSVSPSTVHLFRKLFTETGSLNPRAPLYDRPYLITPEGETFLQLLLAQEVGLTLEEIRYRYENVFGILVSMGTMYNTLERLNFSRKKKTFSDPKKSTAEAKEKYFEELETIVPGKRFYLDETGSCLNMTPLYGRSYQGERVYDSRPTNPGTRVNTIAVLTKEGIKAKYNYTCSLNTKVFICYLAAFVLPIIIDGETLIMDNHPVHRAREVQEFLNKNKVNYLFTPAYSPELNPLEEAF
jgi:transposase